MNDGEKKGREVAPSAESQAEEPSADGAVADLRLRVARHKRMLQRKATRDGGGAGGARIPSSDGSPLPSTVRGAMEPQLGADLAHVRVHTGGDSATAAEKLGARAFAVDSDIHFGAGQFAPGTKEGDRLLAHELTHTVQAKHAGVQRKPGGAAQHDPDAGADGASADEHDVSQPGEPAEQEADSVADHAVANLHGDGAAGGGGAAAQGAAAEGAGSSGGAAATAAPAPRIAAKPIGRKIHRVAVPQGKPGAGYQMSDAPPPAPVDDGKAKAPTDAIDLQQYLDRFGDTIWSGLKAALGTQQPVLGAAYASVTDAAAFTQTVLSSLTPELLHVSPIMVLGANPIAQLYAPVVAPSPVEDAINRGRDAVDGKSAPQLKPGVVTELRNLFAPRFTESVARMAPRYFQARHQAIAAKPKMLNAEEARKAEPKPDDLLVSHPLDRAVARALCSGAVSFDDAAYATANPGVADAKVQPLRKVKCNFIPNMVGWVRVDLPDATPEEVAKELYGDEAHAYKLTPAAPLFCVNDTKTLLPNYLIDYSESQAGGNDPTSADPKGASVVGMNQSKNFAGPGADAKALVGRFQIIDKCLSGMIGVAEPLGVSGGLAVAAARNQGRLDHTKSDTLKAEFVAGLDTESARQLELLKRIEPGLRDASAASTRFSANKNMPPELWQGPLKELAQAWADAGAFADMPATAEAKLKQAEQSGKTFQISLLDNVLARFRQRLAATKNTKGVPVEEVAAQEQKLRAELGEARDLFLTDPAKAQKIVDDVWAQLEDVDTELAFLANMDEVNSYWNQLDARKDKLSPMGGAKGVNMVSAKDQVYGGLQAELSTVKSHWDAVYALYKGGDRKKANEQAGKVRDEAQALFGKIKQSVADEEAKEIVDKIVALLGITVASSGIGAAVGAAMEGAGTLGSLAAAGAEVFSFSTLNSCLDKNPTLKSFIGDLAFNFATAGLVKGAHSAYEAAAGGKEAIEGSKLLGAGDIMTELVVTTGAQIQLEQMKKPKGEAMSDEEIANIVGQNAVQMALSALAQRLGRPFLDGIKNLGEKYTVRIDGINKEREGTKALLEAAKADSHNIETARKPVDSDAKTLASERKLLEEMTADPELKDNPALQEEKKKSVEEWAKGTLNTVTLGLEPQSATVYTTEPGKLDDVLKRVPEAAPGEPKVEVAVKTDPESTQREATLTVEGQQRTIIEPSSDKVTAKATDLAADLKGLPPDLQNQIVELRKARVADKEEKGWIVDPKGEGVTVTGADKQKFGKVEDAPVDAEHFGMDLGKGDTQGKSHIIEKNGETYVIVGTGEAMKVKGVNDKTTMATSGLCSCAGVAIYGEGADGKPLLEVLHPMEDSNVAQQARAVSAVQQLEAEGATNLQIFVTVDPAATMGSKENALAAKLTYASDANPKLFGFAAGPAQLQHAMAEGGVKQKVEVTYAPRPPIPEAGLASPPMRSLYASTSGAGVVYDGGLPAAGHTWKRDAKP